MGRAERRRLERKNRLEDRKGKILMTPGEIAKMKEDITASTIDNFGNYSTEALLTCFALANHRLYGHGLKRTMRTLAYIDELMGYIINDEKNVQDFKNELEDELHVKIDAGELRTWR